MLLLALMRFKLLTCLLGQLMYSMAGGLGDALTAQSGKGGIDGAAGFVPMSLCHVADSRSLEATCARALVSTR
jgi:hypothetical protein